MTTIIIEDNTTQARQLLNYIKTLPYVTIVENRSTSFCEAANECNSTSVDNFIGELKQSITSHFDN